MNNLSSTLTRISTAGSDQTMQPSARSFIERSQPVADEQIVGVDRRTNQGFPTLRERRNEEDVVLQTLSIVPQDAFCEPRGPCYLPPPDEAIVLLREFLADFNVAVPLFEPQDIVAHFDMCYSGKADNTPLPWVVTYIVLGIAHRIRAMSIVGTQEDDSQTDLYLSKSLDTLATLLLQDPSLLLVQCLLGVATLLQMYPPPQPLALVVSTAMRMAQTLDLQESTSDRTSLQHDRTFWIAFVMDMSLCFPTLRLPGQRMMDIDVKLPALSQDPGLHSIPNQGAVWMADLVSLRAELCLIQATSYDRLASVSARKTSIESRRTALDGILVDLQGFRGHTVFSYSPTELRDALFQSEVTHLVRLEAAYFVTRYHLHTHALSNWTKAMDSMSSETGEVEQSLMEACFPDAVRLITMTSMITRCGDAIKW